MKKSLFACLALFSIIVMALNSCGDNQNSSSNDSSTNQESSSTNQESSSIEEVKINGITITSANNVRAIKVDESLQLSATVYPLQALQDVTWSSSNDDVASVNENGLVLGVSVGEVNIIATSVTDSSIFQSFALIIEEKEPEIIYPTSIEISAPENETTMSVGTTLRLSAKVLPVEASQSVSWTSSDTTIATVSRGEVSALKEGVVTITATSRELDTISATYTLTIEKSDNPILNQDFVDMAYTSHETYLSSEDNAKLKIKGVVTHVTPADDENFVNYYIQDGSKGFYIYNQNSITYPVEVGKSYEVGGYKKYYRGLREIVNIEYFKELETACSYTVSSLENVNVSDTDATLPFHASYVTAEATLVNKVTSATKAFNARVNIGGNETDLRVDPSNMTQEEFTKIAEGFTSTVAGGRLTFKGIMSAYGSYGQSTPTTQIQILKSSDLVFEAVNDADLLISKVNEFTMPSTIETDVNKIDLASTLSGVANSTISWACNSELINVTTGEVTHSTDDTEVTLTATFKLNNEVEVREYKINVFGTAADSYEVLVTLDLEDALPAEGYSGNSATKSGYAEGVVTLGGHSWMLRNALISAIANDRYNGTFAIRAKTNSTDLTTGRIEILDAGEYRFIEFAAAVYGNDANAKVGVCYTFDGTTWIDSGTILDVTSKSLETFRVSLPDGEKRVAIYIVAGTGNRVNFDDIKLMK